MVICTLQWLLWRWLSWEIHLWSIYCTRLLLLFYYLRLPKITKKVLYLSKWAIDGLKKWTGPLTSARNKTQKELNLPVEWELQSTEVKPDMLQVSKHHCWGKSRKQVSQALLNIPRKKINRRKFCKKYSFYKSWYYWTYFLLKNLESEQTIFVGFSE